MDACIISDFEAFVDAAEEFHPHIYFFATFNAKVSINDYYLKFVVTQMNGIVLYVIYVCANLKIWKY